MNIKDRICKIGLKVTLAVLVAQIAVFLVLFLFVNYSLSSAMNSSAVSNIKTAAIDRSEIIENYIMSTEDTLTAYLKAEQIYDLLSDPENPDCVAAAQKYTEIFSKDLSNLDNFITNTLSDWAREFEIFLKRVDDDHFFILAYTGALKKLEEEKFKI